MNSKTDKEAGSKKSCGTNNKTNSKTNNETNSKTNSGQADKGEIILYRTPDGQSKIEVTLSGETVWMTADQMAELFQRDKSTISRHIRNVLESGELPADMVVAFFATTTQHGAIKGKTQTRQTAFYNLDMIISIGYRVNSHRGVQFRIWATQVLREYLVKGFAMNDELLNRIVSLYLDFAELQAKSHQPMYMADWIRKLDDFLKLSGKELLAHAGKISAELAKKKADTEYDKFKERTQFQLSPVEIHFLENFEKERKKLEE